MELARQATEEEGIRHFVDMRLDLSGVWPDGRLRDAGGTFRYRHWKMEVLRQNEAGRAVKIVPEVHGTTS